MDVVFIFAVCKLFLLILCLCFQIINLNVWIYPYIICMHTKAGCIPDQKQNNKVYRGNVCVCLQNRSACCVRVVAWSCPLPGVGSGQLTGREVRGWVDSQTLGLL